MAQQSFSSLVATLGQISLASPWYNVLAGTNAGEGVVIAVNATKAVGTSGGSKMTWLSSNSTDEVQPWYVVQTNYDHWLPDPPQDPRRTALERTLNQMGQSSCSLLGVFAAMVHSLLSSLWTLNI